MFALFEDGSTIIMGDRRLRSLRLLNQRLWMFALFEDDRLQAGTGRRNGLSLLSLLSLKKTRGRKTTLLFCFLFSVSCVFYITGFSQLYWFFPIVFYILAFPNYIGFSQLYFIYWLFPIILVFPNCLYSAPVNCPIKKMAPVARSFMM